MYRKLSTSINLKLHKRFRHCVYIYTSGWKYFINWICILSNNIFVSRIYLYIVWTILCMLSVYVNVEVKGSEM